MFTYLTGAPEEQDGLSPTTKPYSRMTIWLNLTDDIVLSTCNSPCDRTSSSAHSAHDIELLLLFEEELIVLLVLMPVQDKLSRSDRTRMIPDLISLSSVMENEVCGE